MPDSPVVSQTMPRRNFLGRVVRGVKVVAAKPVVKVLETLGLATTATGCVQPQIDAYVKGQTKTAEEAEKVTTPSPTDEDNARRIAISETIEAIPTKEAEREKERLVLQEALTKALERELKGTMSEGRFNRVEVKFLDPNNLGGTFTRVVDTLNSGDPSEKSGLNLMWLPLAGVQSAVICTLKEGSRVEGIEFMAVLLDTLVEGEVVMDMVKIKSLRNNPDVKMAIAGGAETIEASGTGVEGYIFLPHKVGPYFYTHEPRR